MDIVVEDQYVLTVTENGFGKRTSVSEYNLQNRNGKGLITHKVTDKTGKVVSARITKDNDELMLINSSNIAIRICVSDVSNNK